MVLGMVPVLVPVLVSRRDAHRSRYPAPQTGPLPLRPWAGEDGMRWMGWDGCRAGSWQLVCVGELSSFITADAPDMPHPRHHDHDHVNAPCHVLSLYLSLSLHCATQFNAPTFRYYISTYLPMYAPPSPPADPPAKPWGSQCPPR